MSEKLTPSQQPEASNEMQQREAYRLRLIESGLTIEEATQIARRTTIQNHRIASSDTSSPITQTDQIATPEKNTPPQADQVTSTEIDYRKGKIPAWVQEVIETHFAIEAEDARNAKSVGFMARALVIATMPYKDPKADVFKRENGDFRLRIVAGYEGGVPYGIYPRLLMSWVTTEAVRTQSPLIELGDSLSIFLRDVLDIQRGGGKRGSSTRVAEQMKRLFGSLITAQYTDNMQNRGFMLKNIIIADDLELYEEDIQLESEDEDTDKSTLWIPQEKGLAGTWKSKVRLSNGFFRECIDKPVPIDLRAYKALRGSPLAMDVYTWLTYRMSYTERRTRPIRWEALMGQFGSNYTTLRAVLDFKKAFLHALKTVLVVYPLANVEVTDNGIILLPSPPHVSKQRELF